MYYSRRTFVRYIKNTEQNRDQSQKFYFSRIDLVYLVPERKPGFSSFSHLQKPIVLL